MIVKDKLILSFLVFLSANITSVDGNNLFIETKLASFK